MTTPATGPFVRDRVWHRGRDGAVLVAGSPATLFRVTAVGSSILDALETGTVLPVGHEALTDRLVFTGAVHPRAGDPWPSDDLTVVVPVHRRGDDRDLESLVAALAPLRTVVVDDASPLPVVLDPDGGRVTVVRLDANLGPAGARNRGLDAVTTDAVAFVDADVVVDAATVTGIAGHLHRERVTAAAPRVRGAGGRGVLARHEVRLCPLDMGPEPSWVRDSARVRYVPSACLVARADTMRAVGGFDESMRTGEDVDLVWRLAQAGHLVRYDPSFLVTHGTRRTLRRYLGQRVGYGRSAAGLAHRHGATVAPFRASLADAGILVAFVLWAWAVGGVLLAATLMWRVARLLRLGAPVRAAIDLVASSSASVVSHAAAALVRTWLPLVVVASVLTPRAFLVAGVAVLVRAGSAVRASRPGVAPLTVVLGPLDDLAYCTGVWLGLVGARSARAMRAVVPVVRWRPQSGR